MRAHFARGHGDAARVDTSRDSERPLGTLADSISGNEIGASLRRNEGIWADGIQGYFYVIVVRALFCILYS